MFKDYRTVGLAKQADIRPRATLQEEEAAAWVPVYALTAVFGALFVIGPLMVGKGPNRGITQCCIMITAVCIWLFWVTTYIAQIHPLLGPRMHNTSLAWIGYKWGKNPKALSGDLDETD